MTSFSAATIAAELGVTPLFDPASEARRRIAFLRDYLVQAGMECLVLGISGGIDSTTAGRLCQLAVEDARAQGAEASFIAMRLPYGQQADEAEAQTALAFIEPDEQVRLNIRPASDAMLASLHGAAIPLDSAAQEDFVLGNIKARQRMIAQYAVAGARRGLVVGTDHAAEAVMGFFTKHGDGACGLRSRGSPSDACAPSLDSWALRSHWSPKFLPPTWRRCARSVRTKSHTGSAMTKSTISWKECR